LSVCRRKLHFLWGEAAHGEKPWSESGPPTFAGAEFECAGALYGRGNCEWSVSVISRKSIEVAFPDLERLQSLAAAEAALGLALFE
jgi:hypothetical protein